MTEPTTPRGFSGARPLGLAHHAQKSNLHQPGDNTPENVLKWEGQVRVMLREVAPAVRLVRSENNQSSYTDFVLSRESLTMPHRPAIEGALLGKLGNAWEALIEERDLPVPGMTSATAYTATPTLVLRRRALAKVKSKWAIGLQEVFYIAVACVGLWFLYLLLTD
jgi:hypothetical protein